MLGTLGRLFAALARFLLFALVLSVIASAVLTMAVNDAGVDAPRIETPDPLPDWPFVWEIPIDDQGDMDTRPQPSPPADDAAGEAEAGDPGRSTTGTDGGTVRSDDVERLIHLRINGIRADHDRPLLRHDEEIADVARAHSHDMAERGYFDHVSPDGVTPADRLDHLFPSACRSVGENIAMVGTTGASDADAIADRVVDGWMNSDGHRENLLRAGWDGEGIGVYLVDESVYATQNFCEDR